VSRRRAVSSAELSAAVVAPQNLEAEESVLGAMLLAAGAIEAVRFLDADDFYRRDSHGVIYRVALELHDAGEPVDAITLVAALEQRGELEAVGGRVRIHELAALVPATANAAHYARIVRERAVLRRQLLAIQAVERAVRDGVLDQQVRDELLVALATRAPSDASWLEAASVLLAEPDPGPTPFLVDELLVEAGIGAVQGTWKIGKTWLLLELALAVVTGRPAFGRFTVPTAGPVLLVVEESGRAALHRRLDALVRGYAIDPSELDGLHFAANRRVRLDNRLWQERLIAAGQDIGVRAIILDPLVRLKGAQRDENVQREIGPVLDYMRDLRDATGAAVVFSHHSGHSGAHMRGSSDLEAYWESKLTLVRNNEGVLELTSDHREAESCARLRYRLDWNESARTMRLAPRDEVDGPHRDLADDVAVYLAEHPGSPTEEIAAGVRARPASVRELLRSRPRFTRVAPPAGRHANAKCWSLAEQPVPDAGTGGDGLAAEPAAHNPSRGPLTPVGGRGADGLEATSRPAEGDEPIETCGSRERALLSELIETFDAVLVEADDAERSFCKESQRT
jgi:hypothetical protein